VPVFTLIRVNLAEGERAWVLNQDFTPVDVAQTTNGLVFTGPPGRYAVLAFSETTQDQKIVEIVGDIPDPGPGPDPDPPPDPDNPPSDLLTKYGLGLVSWREARALRKPAEARTLSQAYIQAANALNEHRMTSSGAQEYVRRIRSQLASDWATWEHGVESALARAVAQHGDTLLHWRNYFYEIGKALEAAAK
jgi:hypothetical protein